MTDFKYRIELTSGAFTYAANAIELDILVKDVGWRNVAAITTVPRDS